MNIQKAIASLAEEPLRFADDAQIRAIAHMERHAGRSNKALDRWALYRARYRDLVRNALDRQTISCTHCGRLPWSVPMRSKCARYIARAYRMEHNHARGASGRWFAEAAREWAEERIAQGYVLRMTHP